MSIEHHWETINGKRRLVFDTIPPGSLGSIPPGGEGEGEPDGGVPWALVRASLGLLMSYGFTSLTRRDVEDACRCRLPWKGVKEELLRAGAVKEGQYLRLDGDFELEAVGR